MSRLRDLTDPAIVDQMDPYLREYLADGYTEEEIVDSLARWRMLFPGSDTLAVRRMVRTRIAALSRRRVKRGPGRPRGWTPEIVRDRVREARRAANVGDDSPPEAWARHFRLLNGRPADPKYVRRLMAQHGVA
jgi:hypothetical protein